MKKYSPAKIKRLLIFSVLLVTLGLLFISLFSKNFLFFMIVLVILIVVLIAIPLSYIKKRKHKYE
ncbi:MAG: hypothetical protein LBV51_00795 [Acholeplasmatales bacterium]|jgi:uncharacterized membrane protein YgaE (UPF0421/DUF939 family)|nr:hypothetical protein [Acholeplasmatales bacterium]